jgi:hypothetical protein
LTQADSQGEPRQTTSNNRNGIHRHISHPLLPRTGG